MTEQFADSLSNVFTHAQPDYLNYVEIRCRVFSRIDSTLEEEVEEEARVSASIVAYSAANRLMKRVLKLNYPTARY